MIISHKYKFIFVKTAKVAGTSIEVFLSQYCGPQDVLTPIFPHVEPHSARNYEGYFNHMPAHQIRERVGPEIWDTYFKFCVERNPWEKALSWYRMKTLRGDRDFKDLTFDAYLAGTQLPINFPHYTEPNNPDKMIVNRVLYFERLMDDLGQVFEELGIPFQGSLGVNAKSEYSLVRRPYQEFYTPEQANTVGNRFRQEILLHGNRYKF